MPCERWQNIGRWMSVVMVAAITVAAQASIFNEKMDAEIADLHAIIEQGMTRVTNVTAALRVLGFGQAGQAVKPSGSGKIAAPAELETRLRQLQEDFGAMQRQAYKIGSECQNNEDLAQHPDVYPYLQTLREMKTRIEMAEIDLEKEHKRMAGKPFGEPQKAKKRKKEKGPPGFSLEDVQAKARSKVAQDERLFRVKAMDLQSSFREHQLKVQDKQQDLQRVMEGPDWPKEDWPLSTSDAKAVGDAEMVMQSSLNDLKQALQRMGGLERVHESNDESILEKLQTLNMIMDEYCELIERHVETVKKTQKQKTKKTKKKKVPAAAEQPAVFSQASRPPGSDGGALQDASSIPPIGGSIPASRPGISLHEKLMAFGQAKHSQPFAWLRDEGAKAMAGKIPPISQAPPIPQAPSRQQQWAQAMPVYHNAHGQEL
eukprot:gnl/MRDRNA2_/MRDRNA2_123410_c0_seq1.p1 gnl/MRDRNA2_/MRDRNA2_123410_c0~~gnl/MRDRNA2_/MRDRNA2_123410_c0_seq1.p1  ORF type:complete len:430 (-),score=140.37 gnl/MRDRNA2_/MRDRNA2_123410_c0_seq1:113-1402(-)